MKTEELKMRTIRYPQILRLPNGTHFVLQNGYRHNGSIDKYSSFSKAGRLFVVSAGNSLKAARKNTLDHINHELRNVNLVWGDDAPKSEYARVLN